MVFVHTNTINGVNQPCSLLYYWGRYNYLPQYPPCYSDYMKKQGLTYWHNKVWKVFSQYIRMRDYAEQLDPEPYIASCISCGRGYPIAGQGCLQAGHFITRVRGSILYDEKNVHAQCYNCNYRLKGNWDRYYDAMLIKYGQDTIDELLNKRFNIHKFTIMELQQMYDDYMRKLSQLTDQHGNPF